MGLNTKNILFKGFLGVLIISAVPTLIGVLRCMVGICDTEGEEMFSYFFSKVFYSIATTSILFMGSIGIINFLNRQLSWEKSVPKRLVLELISIFTFSTLAQIVILKAFSYSSFLSCQDLTFAVYFENILFGNTITFMVVTLIEGNYFLQQWKQTLIQAEKAKQESIKSQFGSLKAQLDPHFLFNSLNVLSSLIRKDLDRAELFIDDFAKVYRYVLEVKDEMVVDLNSELEFLKAYVNLQQIRFGKALQLEMKLDPSVLEWFVPPLSLQELVNNAIKHNEVLEERPLIIEVYNEGKTLVIKNNLQPRKDKIISTKLGIENLKKRYALLNNELPEFSLTQSHFIAKIPMIEGE